MGPPCEDPSSLESCPSGRRCSTRNQVGFAERRLRKTQVLSHFLTKRGACSSLISLLFFSPISKGKTREPFTETYRSGHNGAHSKCVDPQGPWVRIPPSPPKKPYSSSTVGLFLFPLERKDVVLPTLKKCSRANRSPGSDGQAPGPSAWPPPRRVWSGNPGARRCSPSC